jgi:hypothetical protein
MFLPDKRKYRRLAIKLGVFSCKTESKLEKAHKGYTVNICTGGMYFEAPSGEYKPGHLLKIDLVIPPIVGVLEFGGTISVLARVLRTQSISNPGADKDISAGKCGVGVEFYRRPRLYRVDQLPSKTSTAGPVM